MGHLSGHLPLIPSKLLFPRQYVPGQGCGKQGAQTSACCNIHDTASASVPKSQTRAPSHPCAKHTLEPAVHQGFRQRLGKQLARRSHPVRVDSRWIRTGLEAKFFEFLKQLPGGWDPVDNTKVFALRSPRLLCLRKLKPRGHAQKTSSLFTD